MSQTKLHSILNKVNILYEEYMKTHDYLMSKWMTIRYFISIVGKIKPVEYDVLLNNMDIVLKHLKSCINDLQQNSSQYINECETDFISISAYSESLYDAIWILKELLYKIQIHQEGKTRYSISDYNFDMKNYKAAVRKYYSIGENYNKLLDKNKVD